MTVYYLIVGNKIKQEIDAGDTDVTVLPILDSARACSLLNRAHIIALMNKYNRTANQIIGDLGLTDERPAE